MQISRRSLFQPRLMQLDPPPTAMTATGILRQPCVRRSVAAGWNYGVGAGVFALHLYGAPSNRHVSIGFRACKYPRQHWPDPAGVILPAVPQETWGCNPRYIRLCRLAKHMNR